MNKEHLFHFDEKKSVRVTGRLDRQPAIPGAAPKKISGGIIPGLPVQYRIGNRKRFVD